MSPILLHIYGPIAIHSFGFMIVIGLLITLYLLQRDVPLQKFITHDELTTIVHISFLAGITGGRLWFLLLIFKTLNIGQSFFSFGLADCQYWELLSVYVLP